MSSADQVRRSTKKIVSYLIAGFDDKFWTSTVNLYVDAYLGCTLRKAGVITTPPGKAWHGFGSSINSTEHDRSPWLVLDIPLTKVRPGWITSAWVVLTQPTIPLGKFTFCNEVKGWRPISMDLVNHCYNPRSTSHRRVESDLFQWLQGRLCCKRLQEQQGSD